MGDLYVEHLVKRKTPGHLMAAKYGLYGLCALTLLLGIMMPILLLLPIVLIILTRYLTNRWNVEYEYLYVNGDLDFDVIMSASKRKKKLSVSVHDLELMAPSGFAELKQFEQQQIKTYNFSSMTDSKKEYVMILNKDDARIRVIFEPTKEIVDGMKMMEPRKVLPGW